jgi:hypothetical protein
VTPAAAHELLGTVPGATGEQIRRAYRRYMLVAHPDHGGDAERVALGVTALRTLSGDGARPARAPATVVFVRRPALRTRAAMVGRRHARVIVIRTTQFGTHVRRRLCRRPWPGCSPASSSASR